MSRPLRAFVDASALAHNLRRVREAAPGRRVIAIVKADTFHAMAMKILKIFEREPEEAPKD